MLTSWWVAKSILYVVIVIQGSFRSFGSWAYFLDCSKTFKRWTSRIWTVGSMTPTVGEMPQLGVLWSDLGCNCMSLNFVENSWELSNHKLTLTLYVAVCTPCQSWSISRTLYSTIYLLLDQNITNIQSETSSYTQNEKKWIKTLILDEYYAAQWMSFSTLENCSIARFESHQWSFPACCRHAVEQDKQAFHSKLQVWTCLKGMTQRGK